MVHLEWVFRETGKLVPSRLLDSRLIRAHMSHIFDVNRFVTWQNVRNSREPGLVNPLSVQYQSHFDYAYCNFVSIPFRIWNIAFASCWCTNRDRKNHRIEEKNDLVWFSNKFSPYFSFYHPRIHFSSCFQIVAYLSFQFLRFLGPDWSIRLTNQKRAWKPTWVEKSLPTRREVYSCSTNRDKLSYHSWSLY